ncbi:MAG: SDR family NAD(P)-dependent oxidoreductase [Roseinatronobacter sp.]
MSGPVLVTGASHGVGFELVRLLAARGVPVLATGRRAQADLPIDFPDCRYLRADLADPVDLARVVAMGAAQPLAGAILNAGIGFYRGIEDEAPADIARVLAVNLDAQIALAHGLRGALSGGYLGLIGSVARKGAAGMPVYAASKGGLDGFGRALAQESRGQVRVRVLHPGPTATGMAERAGRARDAMDRLFLPPALVARAILRALEAPRGADRQVISFARIALERLRGAT